MADLGVGVGAASSAVDDAAADLRDCVAGEGERGGRDSLPEGEFDGPAATLLDGLRGGGGGRERLPWGTAAAAAGVSVAAAASTGVRLAAERREVPPPLSAVPYGLHVRAAAAAA